MKKLINLFLVLVVGLMLSACASLETSYAVTKKGVQTFVSDEKREKYHTKDLDKIVTGTYSIIRGISNKEFDQTIDNAAFETDRELETEMRSLEVDYE